MNIAFDATAILGPLSRNRGIGNYALAQFKTMMELDKKNKYICINFFEDSVFGNDTNNYKNLKEYKLWCGKNQFLSVDINYIDIYKNLVQCFVKKNDIDVFYVTSPFEGFIFPYQREWFGQTRVIGTVYDTIPYAMKDIYLRDKTNYQRHMERVECIKRFDKLLVISNSVKNDLIKYFNIDEKKIEVMYGAAGDVYKKVPVPDKEKNILCNKFNIKNNFIMCTGGDDSRKNIQGIIEAYAKLPSSLINDYQLVIVCKLSSSSVQMYNNLATTLGLKGRVILTNYVMEDELLYLYNMTSLMAFPSKYEGFGLPVVEAFACGVPVLTSNNSSLGEIAEGAAVLVDPFNVDDIAHGLEYALTKADKEQYIRKGYEKLKLYTWNNVASIALNAINELEQQKTIAKIKKRIAFFTPLPPIESGISDYSVDILNSLSQYFDIDVFIDDGYRPKCHLPDNIKMYSHRMFKKRYRDYHSFVYQMGNSEFHNYMYSYIKKYRGIVVLHDYNLHSAAYHNSVFTKKDYELYREYLLEEFPVQVVDKYLDDLRNNRIFLNVYNYELNGYITNYAKKIIVHSEELKEKLLKKDIGRNVCVIRSYAKIEELKDIVQMKEKYGYSKDDIIISSFGHIHETKRAMPALKAFHKLSERHKNAFYIFAGKLDVNQIQVFNEYVKKNNLSNKVTVTGYIDLETFIDYIDATDICVNLRYPHNGETSGSLMRILASGKCVIVSDIGSFREIPDECCVKLPNAGTLTEQEEVNRIYEAMESLIVNNEQREVLSKAARKYAEETLDIEIIAKKYYDFIVDDYNHALTEDTIQRIKDHELLDKNYTNDEIGLLSKTLAYTLR